MGRLLLVRHGQSLWNRDGIIQGQDGPGLSPLGHDQARAVAARLAAEVPDAVLVTSDLDRCVETIAPLEELLGRHATRDERVRERHFGDWQGSTHDQVRTAAPEAYDRWMAREDVLGEVGGESHPVFVDRVLPVLAELAAAAEVTVVSTHGGVIWHGVHALIGVPEPLLGPVSNASVHEIEVEEAGRARLVGWNGLGHLAPEQRTTWNRRRRTRRDSAA